MKTLLTYAAAILLSVSLFTGNARAAFVTSSTEKSEDVRKETLPPATPEQEKVWLQQATDAISTMSRSERKAHTREFKKAFREWRATGSQLDDTNNATYHVLLIILAIFIPPLAVALHEHGINSKFWISLLLTILFFIPGMIYSILVCADVA